MNERQRFAFECPSLPGAPPRHELDHIELVGDLNIITRVICYAPGLGTIGSWQARATILSESGERLSTIFLTEDQKAEIQSRLIAMLEGVGKGEVSFAELACTIAGSKDLTHEEFEHVMEKVAGGPLPPIRRVG